MKIFCFKCNNEIPELEDKEDFLFQLDVNFCNDCFEVMK